MTFDREYESSYSAIVWNAVDLEKSLLRGVNERLLELACVVRGSFRWLYAALTGMAIWDQTLYR